MTHTCTTSPKTRFLCPVVTSHFSAHRPFADALYTGLNFGTLEFDWSRQDAEQGSGGGGGGGGAVLTASVVGADGAAVFSVRRHSCAYVPAEHAAEAGTTAHAEL